MNNVVLVLSGPNLNLLGKREPEIYGADTLADAEAGAVRTATELGLTCVCKQSNHEGRLVDWIQEARENAAAIVINPGGYSHTSIAIHDALLAFDGPVMEVHVSNIYAREAFRHHSYVSLAATGVIAGCGIDGYALAVRRIAGLLSGTKTEN